jgi:hypothetical protein
MPGGQRQGWRRVSMPRRGHRDERVVVRQGVSEMASRQGVGEMVLRQHEGDCASEGGTGVSACSCDRGWVRQCEGGHAMWARGEGGWVRQHEGGRVSTYDRGWVREDGGDRVKGAPGECVLVRQGDVKGTGVCVCVCSTRVNTRGCVRGEGWRLLMVLVA